MQRESIFYQNYNDNGGDNDDIYTDEN